jgi:hypothetical protein
VIKNTIKNLKVKKSSGGLDNFNTTHGVRSSSSTTLALLDLVNTIARDKGKHSIALFLLQMTQSL